MLNPASSGPHGEHPPFLPSNSEALTKRRIMLSAIKTSIKTHPMKREPPPVLPNLPKTQSCTHSALSLVPRFFCDTIHSSATSRLWDKALVPQTPLKHIAIKSPTIQAICLILDEVNINQSIPDGPHRRR